MKSSLPTLSQTARHLSLLTLLCAAPTLVRAQSAAPSVPGAPSPGVGEHPLTTDGATSTTGGLSTTTGEAASGLRLSLRDALAMAQANHPLARGAQARLEGAEARLRAARARLNPTLSLAQPFGSTSTGGFDEGVLVTQTLESAGKRGPRTRAAQAERDAAQSQRAGTGVDLASQVAAAYFEALRAGGDQTLATAALTAAQTFRDAAQTQFQAGDVARSNVVRAEVEAARADSALTQGRADRDNRLSELKSLVGLPDNAAIVLTDALDFAPATYDAQALRDLAMLRRDDLKAARLLRAAREANVQGARAENKPDLFVEGRRTDLGVQSGTSVRVGVTLPIFDFGRNRAGVGEARAAVSEQQAALDESTRGALLEVDTALRSFQAAQQAVQTFKTGRLERARELLDMAQIGYQQGANSYLELLDAQNIYRAEQVDYGRALAAWNIARAALERAVGGQLP